MTRPPLPAIGFEAAIPQFTVPDVVQTPEYYRNVSGFEIAGYWGGERPRFETEPVRTCSQAG